MNFQKKFTSIKVKLFECNMESDQSQTVIELHNTNNMSVNKDF